MTTIIGIDTGLSGAICTMHNSDTIGVIEFDAIPTVGSKKARAYDLRGIYNAVAGMSASAHIFIEGFASFGLGTSAVHSLVRCITAFEMAALHHGIRITVVPARTWQKVMFENVEPADLKPKAKAKIACERLWGAESAKWNEGRRDAALIAEYGRRLG